MDSNQNIICVTSFNSGGLGLEKQHFIKTLNLFTDILCLQEHFLLDSGSKKYSNTSKLQQFFGDTHDMFIKAAYKSSNTISKGRGSGGLAILWKKSLTKYVSQIESENYRVQAAKFSFPESHFLLVNLYFMVDPQNDNFNDLELMNILSEIERIISASDCKHVLLAGDLNCDFSRNTNMVNIVKQFIESNGLEVFWTNPYNPDNPNISEVRYTYSNTVNNVTHSSIIDHFIGNSTLYNSVVDADVIHSVDNHSNHSPIYTKFNVNELNIQVEELDYSPKPNWKKAGPLERDQFKQHLKDILDTVSPPEPCNLCINLNCDEHDVVLDEYATSICQAVNTAAMDCLPKSGGANTKTSRKGIPGWNEYVKPYQDESLFWNSLWRAAGNPDQGDLYQLHRESKMQYKYAVRRLKRASNNIKKDNFINGLLNGGVNIFTEIKKLRGKSRNVSSTVDGRNSSQDISEHFAQIYQELYQRHELGDEFNDIYQSIDSRIDATLLQDIDKVNTKTVAAALDKLKSSKSDPVFDFNSDCLINSPPELIHHVTNLFKWFLRSGKVPAFLLLCTIVPIVKDNIGDITSSENYRAIAIGSLILKWFDWLIIILEEENLTTDELQFGFQANSSTSLCTWGIVSVVDYYNRAGRPVFACSMDLSKAFDLVAWKKLFPELLDRNVSPLLLRCLLYIYANQKCNVRWGNNLSRTFSVTNGVRQGAVSSPILFCVYINKLISQLRRSDIGCQLSGIYLGIWIYADDIVLLSPSRYGLQCMTTICENFAKEMSLKFSTNLVIEKSKTKCIIFNKDNLNSDFIHPIILNGQELPYVSEIKHLGNVLQIDNSMNNDCNIKRAKFISKLHSLGQEFYFADPVSVVKLYSIYACDFYGSQLWDFNSDNVLKLYNSWNVSIRILFDVPRNAHRYLIEPLSRCLHIKTLLASRFVAFSEKLNCTKKLCIRLLYNLFKNDHRTILCKNLNSIADDCHILVDDLSKHNVKQNLTFSKIPDDQTWKVPLICELIDIKSNLISVDNFDYQELNEMIIFLCTD